ncbi:MAG: SPOR domain-containing protein [Planctomycetota bacterium]
MRLLKTLPYVMVLASCGPQPMVEPEDPPALFKRGQDAILDGDKENARRILNRFLSTNRSGPYAAEAHYHLGRMLLEEEKFERARDEFVKASRTSDREQTYVLARLGEARTWVQDVDTKESPNPEEVATHVSKPESSRYAEALKIYRDLWENHASVCPPEEVLNGMGEAYLKLSEPRKAKEVYDLLMKTCPDSAQAKKIKNRELGSFKAFSAQVGAFKDSSRAEAMMDKLRSEGFEPYLIHEKLYYVRVGRFRNYQEAKTMASKLEAKGYKAFLVP